MFWLKGEIKKNNNFYKKIQKKKLEIKTTRTTLKNIIQSIEIVGWNWKSIKLLQKFQEIKLEIQKIRTKLKYIKFDKLGLNDKIKNK